MDHELFLARGRRPQAWLEMSIWLRRSAEALFELCVRPMFAEGWDRDGEYNYGGSKWGEPAGYYVSAMMLYGLSLETAFKYVLIRDHPTLVKFAPCKDKAGTVVGHMLTHIKGEKVNHKLERLAELAGVLDQSFDYPVTDPLCTPTNQVDAEKVRLRMLLRDLTDVVVWKGRYPIPLRSNRSLELDPTYPAGYSPNYMRDIVAPLLDRLQTPPSSPTPPGVDYEPF